MEFARDEREAQLNTLMLRYEKDVLRLCCAILRDASLAQDAVQETFIKAYRKLDGFRGDSSEKTWLMHIAINTCRDMRRSAWFRFMDRRVSLEALPEPVAEPTREHELLTLAVMRLPRRELEAVLLRYDQGMQVREIAQALGISPSAVSQRLKHAHARLRRELEGGEVDAGV